MQSKQRADHYEHSEGHYKHKVGHYEQRVHHCKRRIDHCKQATVIYLVLKHDKDNWA